MSNTKYTVIKPTSLAELRVKYAQSAYALAALSDVEEAAIADAVVLRGQDVFAKDALQHYVEAVLAQAELAGDPEIRAQLIALADQVHSAAVYADTIATIKKLPD